MKTITKNLELQPNADIINAMQLHIHDKTDEIVIFDIETTGLSARNACCFLIGCIYQQNNIWQYTQWFCDTFDDEKKVLFAFIEFIKPFKYIVSYNGDSFDIPFIKRRLQFYGVSYEFSALTSIDILKDVRHLKALLKLDRITQKDIEKYVKYERTDTLSGKDLIEIYKQFIAFHENSNLDLLLLHNHDDISGLLNIIPILNYYDIISGNFDFISAKICSKETKQSTISSDISANNCTKELIMTFSLNDKIAENIELSDGPYNLCITSKDPSDENTNAYFVKNDMQKNASYIVLCVRLFCGELKYFFENYNDYYYLPDEDEAIHKSVAAYVDKNYRKQAKAYNCYKRKKGEFIPQPDSIISPFFKQDYKNTDYYFEVSDKFLNSPGLCIKYAVSIINSLI